MMKRSLLLLLLLTLSLGTSLDAQPCDPDGPGGPAQTGGLATDVIVGQLPNVSNWGNAGGYYAYSVGTTSCNIGTEELQWIAGNNQHPVIGQNLYRLKDGRFEHIGQSWLKHGFTALQQNSCGCGCISSGTGTRLGVGCSDPYSSGLNGGQNSAGAKSEVTGPSNGFFIYPQVLDPPNPDVTWRRLRVAAADMDPNQNAGALYFIEGQYITPDDAAAGNGNNNVSYRQVTVGSNTNTYPLSLTGPTVQTFAGIQAWQNNDPTVTLTNITTDEGAGNVPGLMILGHKVTDNGNGTWHYEYALYNMNSTRGAASFSVPIGIGVNVTNIDFSAPEYHSNEVYVNDAWNATNGSCALTWEVVSQTNPSTENGLFWGTMYNFRFDADAAPTSGDVSIDYYQTGTPSSLLVTTEIPTGAVGSGSPPVTGLNCTTTDQTVQLSWNNPVTYTSIDIHKDGVLLTTKLGTDTSHTDAGAGVGNHQYTVTGVVTGQCSFAASCQSEVFEPLAISYPSGVPSLISPFGEAVDVEIVELNGTRQSGSEKLFYDAGAGFVEVTLTPQGGSLFSAQFPPITCGSNVSYYFQAQDTFGTTLIDPPDAPSSTYSLVTATGFDLGVDDMEMDTGWTVGDPTDTATTGIWERGDPVGTASQPEDDHSVPGTLCWFTGQHPAGGSTGSNDIDGGKTTLTTPPIDLSGMSNPMISYWRWFKNDGVNTPDDTFIIDITADGTNWVNVETLGPNDANSVGGWIFHQFAVNSFITPSSTVQMRFVPSDFGAGSFVEAAIDDFFGVDVPACDDDCNGNMVADADDISMGTSQDCNTNNIPDECEIAAGAPDVNMNGIPDECEGASFERGDCNADGGFDLSDPVRHLGILFASEPPAPCEDACDTNDDGLSNIADAVAALNALFGLGTPPPAPVGVCGLDPTADSLPCATFTPCP
ncbi:MAG: hypothetical protein AAF581_20235 [Planctomycetota bacterium]